MCPDQYLGWLALALRPGLGARIAGKLLSAMGSPDRIFSPSLTELESHRLPAAVAQAIHARKPPESGCLRGTSPNIHSACARFTIAAAALCAWKH
jgi:hypothetical protein